jgi:hypothetical protein
MAAGYAPAKGCAADSAQLTRVEAFPSQSRSGYLKIIRLAAIIPIVANR